MEEKFIRDALILWATVDPIGTLVIFVGLTSNNTPRERSILAIKAVFYAGVILFGSIVIGQILLAAIGVELASLQIAGGIILFLFGLQMVFGLLTQESPDSDRPGHNPAMSPLAIPSIANPGTIMAVIILTDNRVHPIPVQIVTASILFAVLVIAALLMIASGPILKLIGNTGSSMLIRVMGMILAALSVEFVLGGLGV